MGVVLPEPLVWVLNLIGVNWPNIDEDKLVEFAGEIKNLAGELNSMGDGAKADVAKALAGSSSEALQQFDAVWSKVADGHLPQLAQGFSVLGDGLHASSYVITGLKVAAIAQLAILAAEIIADQVAAPVTLGASELAVPLEAEATSLVVKRLVKQAGDTLVQQMLQVVEGPVFQSLADGAQELSGQLLGNYLGTSNGVDLGKVATAGGHGFEHGVDNGLNLAGGEHHEPTPKL